MTRCPRLRRRPRTLWQVIVRMRQDRFSPEEIVLALGCEMSLVLAVLAKEAA